MYDLHSHILPGVDDGAPDLETALEMAKLAVKKGISTIAATPHHDLIFDWPLIQSKVVELANNFKELGIELKLISGAELFMDHKLLSLSKEQIPTYDNNGKYCLLEFPMFEIPNYSEEVLFSFKIKELIPIIAHPERYRNVVEDPNIISAWIENGCLIQMNAGSITGMFGDKIRKTSKILLEHQMVHIMASDAHSTGRRGFILDQGVEEAKLILGEELGNRLVYDHPRKVVAGEHIEVPEVVKYKRRRFWFF